MTQRGRSFAAALEQRLAHADAATIDRLYGLEPVFEPAEQSDAALGEFVETQCPWCGEVFGSHVDLTDGSRFYIEDCQVCCQPIEITLEVNAAGELCSVGTARPQ
jgi:hypothetical protein